MFRFLMIFVLIATGSISTVLGQKPADTAQEGSSDDAAKEAVLITETRQITFEGRRAGEGYFSGDGKRMVFQSERDPANPFYQIYVMDLETGDVEKVSPGHGKTTCAWIHPDGKKVLFASTQDDPKAKRKQKDELDFRASGKSRRYAWDYDDTFELYERSEDGSYRRLTNARGYDAEASYSPDGSLIAFASNRQAFEKDLTPRDKQLFETDAAYMNDIYLMNADGSNVRRLTDVPGYDGGPFFSPDGKRICWRRFSVDGATAEIYSMNIDGSDVRRLTEIGAMSWAPFFHPSGDYLIFATNKHGFGNFELYLVRADGKGQPVRATYTDGFDGLPVFLPDGNRLAWTSTRTESKRSQIFMAEWNDSKARELLELESSGGDRDAALAAAEASTPDFSPADVMRHVDFLTRQELGGRLTGTEGEKRATAYVAAYLESLGFLPAGENGTFFHEFEFPAGSELTDDNMLKLGDELLPLNGQWLPLSFSGLGKVEPTEVVFAGYGMQVPASEGVEEYDSYVHLDVQGKWVVVLRDLPQDITPERRQQLARFSAPRRKASIARDMGAEGIIFVAGPTSKVSRQLLRFDRDASQASVSLAVISVTNEVARKIFTTAEKDLSKLQKSLDDGSMQMGFALEGVKMSAQIGIQRNKGIGRNVIARLPAGDTINMQQPVVMLGAHIDHLGNGGSGSLAKDDERDLVHVGADDNASGVASMLEIAQYLSAEKKAGRLVGKRDFVVAAWSGEELGLFGSQAFVGDFYDLYPDAPRQQTHAHSHGHAHPHGDARPAGDAQVAGGDKKQEGSKDAKEENPHAAVASAHGHGASQEDQPLTPAIAAYLNLDMVGRLREKLVVQGIGSSPKFGSEVQRRNVPVGLKLQLDKTSTRLPTDASAFVGRNVPILSAFTGAHEDYHTPRDTPDKLNYEGAAKISRLFALLARGMLTAESVPQFELNEGEASEQAPRVRLTAYLGTIPDYVAGDVVGLKLSGVAKNGPAAEAGMQGGDIIVKLAGRKIENIYDYTYAIEALKIGEAVEVVVKRGEATKVMKIVPGSRD